MSFEADFKSHMGGASALSAVIENRLRPIQLDQDETMPAATYTIVSSTPQNSIDGFTSNLTNYLVQMDFWAEKTPDGFGKVVSASIAARDRMNTAAATFRGVVTDFPLFDDYDDEVKRYRRTIQISCWYREP
jgi:hypothetical protein